MARPNKKQADKKKTEAALYKALEDFGLKEKYYEDQVSEYMKYYSNLDTINDKLSVNLDIDLLKEKRQVTKEMRSILAFLGLKPAESGGGGFEEL